MPSHANTNFAGGRPAVAPGAITYRPDIDGLRAIAVVSVVLYHIKAMWMPGGFMGVDIFFVISGYLIGGQIYREAGQRKFRFAGFYARRLRRILPALLVLVVALMAAGMVLLTPIELRELSKETIATVVGLANVLFYSGGGYFTPSAELQPLLMTWSLGVEEQFYFVFPFVLLALIRVRPGAVQSVLILLSLVAFIGSLVLTQVNQPAAFYLLPTRTWELGFGAVLAIREDHGAPLRRGPFSETAAVIGLALIVIALVFYRPRYDFPGMVAMLPVLGTTLLIASRASVVNRRLLSLAPITFIGLVSYSLYLWHWPLIYLARVLGEAGSAASGVWLIFGSLAAAVLSWRFVEQPLRRRVLPEATAIVRYGIAVFVVAGAALALYLADGWPGRLPAAARPLAEQARVAQNDPCLATFGDRALRQNDTCLPPPAAGQARMAVIGDSHASAAMAGFRRLAAANGLGIAQMTKSSCIPLAGYAEHLAGRPAQFGECTAFQKATYRYLKAHPDIRVVALTGYWSSRMQVTPADAPDGATVSLRDALNDTVRKLHAMGKHVILVQDAPKFDFDPYSQAIASLMPVRAMLQKSAGGETEAPPQKDASRPVIAAVAHEQPGVTLIDPVASLCDAGGCRYRAPGSLYYFDYQHLTAPGALAAIPVSSLPH